MRAVFVHDHYFSTTKDGRCFSRGGLPYAVWEQYLKVFDEIHVIGRCLASDLEESPPGVESSGPGVTFGFIPNLSRLSSYFNSRLIAQELLKASIASSDALIARTSQAAKLAVTIARELSIPYAVEVVGCAWDAYCNYGSLMGSAYAPIAYLQQKHMVQRAPYAIYVTDSFLQSRYPCNGITMGVSDVRVALADPSCLVSRQARLCVRGRKVVFGTIGSLATKYKGIDTALRALSNVRRRIPDFEYRILGSGDQSLWRRMAVCFGLEKNVVFSGTLPSGPAVHTWLDDIDIYLQPSLTEGLPRALLEAMSRGCPCLASSVGGIPELLGRECLHPPGDVRLLEGLIHMAVNSAQWRTHQAVRNHSHAGRYEAAILDAKRLEFWRSFAGFVRKRKPKTSAGSLS